MRPISDYAKQNEFNSYLEDPDTGIEYDNISEFLQSRILGHCGCGLPDENLKLIHDILNMHENNAKEILNTKNTEEKFLLFKKHREEIEKYICKNVQKFYSFFFYVMNDKQIMTHGGSIPGWICDHNFMEAIKIWHEKEYEEEED